MEIAVLSDIHGNHIGLQRCLKEAYLRGIERFFFLGDYLGELAYPQKTMKILYALQEKYPCEFIRGNKEDYWLNYRKNGEKGWKKQDSVTGCLYYSYHQLNQKDFDFYERMPLMKKIEFENLPAIMICHGSPRRTNEKMLPDSQETFAVMEACDTNLILCGHTHVRGVIEHGGKKVINAGSVGVPLYEKNILLCGKAQTQMVVLHGEDGCWKEEFIGLDYDVERVITELHECGLYENAPSWCRVTEHLLFSGTGSHGAVLERAMQLCEAETGNCVWPDVPEVFLKRAIEEVLGRG